KYSHWVAIQKRRICNTDVRLTYNPVSYIHIALRGYNVGLAYLQEIKMAFSKWHYDYAIMWPYDLIN
ncbi:MAG TPA: hypothetical protein DEP47_14350, partial [Chloroflexi bacterium]|nr:hypothetical protein [Chloroflexota bacterium]